MSTTTTTKLLPVKEVATACDVGILTVHRWIKHGRQGVRLQSQPEGGRVYVSCDDLDKFIAQSNSVGNIEANYSRLS